MQINEMQLQQVNRQIERLVNSGNFYGKKLKDAGIDEYIAEVQRQYDEFIANQG